MDSIHAVETNSLFVRRRYFPAINWGAIIAGIVVGMATQIVLALLGVAAGLSVIARIGQGADVAMWVALWQGVSMLAAAFVGGYVAARMSGLQRNGDGMLHGLVTWGATTLLAASLASSGLGALFASGVSFTQPHEQAGAALRRQPVSASTSAIVPEIFVQAPMTTQPVEPIQAQQQATRPVSAPSWWAFGAAALSMLLGIFGGFAGAAGARRNRFDAPREAPF